MIIYIAGKMTGLPDLGRAAFAEAEKKLTAEGHTVLNPAWMPSTLRKECYMPICLAMLDAADAIYMIDGWQDSKGATIEKLYAEYHGKMVYDSTDLRHQPVCPYCGTEMHGCYNSDGTFGYSYVCVCGAKSPSGGTKDDAYEMAMKLCAERHGKAEPVHEERPDEYDGEVRQ